MAKGIIGLVSVIFLTASSLATEVVDVPLARLTEADMKNLTDARVGLVRKLLQITPEQERNWPPVEEAMRLRAAGRFKRIMAAYDQLDQKREANPVELLRLQAAALVERAAEVNRLADAWQPLYQNLNPNQKQRMRLLAQRVLRDAADTEMYSEDIDQD